MANLLFSLHFFLSVGVLDIVNCAITPLADPHSNGGNETDYLALLGIKSEIQDDPAGIMLSWNSSVHHCSWPGVRCGLRHQRVTVLDLSSRGLVGSLSPFIGNLSFVREILFQNNSLTGQIPPQIGRLSRLQNLHLGNNSFNGGIPANLSNCSSLMNLLLRFNNLVGSIPSELSSFTNLRRISVFGNNLTGDVLALGNLTTLESLDVSDNAFEGEISDGIGKMKHLSFLAFAGNRFSGLIPPSIYNLSSLAVLRFSDNRIEGRLPPNIAQMLPHLQVLSAQYNFLSGPLPNSFSNRSMIQTLSLSANNFTGKILLDGRNLPDISYLCLDRNNLGVGESDDLNFLNTFTNCSRFKLLSVSGNSLGGVLPPSLVNFSEPLRYVDVSGNRISGTLPSHLDNLVNLYYFSIAGNNIEGFIPSNIGRLSKLGIIDFSYNNLSGKIPLSFGNLSHLSYVDLGHNQLRGEIPLTLENCSNLLLLSLSNNNLTGALPNELFHISALSVGLHLSGNHLQGNLPSEVGLLSHLALLDISDNELSGSIPQSLGSCISLTSLNMGGNFFHGNVPLSLSSLTALQHINLSHNYFSGQIPSYFSSLSLDILDLSFNSFEGEVPLKGVFLNVSGVSLLGNNKLCGGIVQLHLPKCIIRYSKGRKHHLLFILVMSIPCVLLVGLATVLLVLFHLRKKRKDPSPDLLRDPFLTVSYDMLLKATDGFSPRNLIGAGGFGYVYKGILNLDRNGQNGLTVAVKVLNLQGHDAAKSFMAECKALRNVRHRNLVRIITTCSSIDFQGYDFKALVYEFMLNESLESWIHSNHVLHELHGGFRSLTLLQRVNIAVDVAFALEYLHHHCEVPIIHCDLKPSNILLDDDMVAHVGDFGLARFVPELTNHSQNSSIGVKGSIGYTAPEYGLGSQVSTNGDIYSFGIVLLEMMTGKRPTDHAFENGLSLHKFVKMAFPDRVMEIADARLVVDDDVAINTCQSPSSAESCGRRECISLLMKIGVSCSMDSPCDRMNITDAINTLKFAKDMLLGAEFVRDVQYNLQSRF